MFVLLHTAVFAVVPAAVAAGTVMLFSHKSKTTTRQMLNLCIPIMPFTPGLSDLV